MTPAEFVACVAKEKEDMLTMCTDPESESAGAAEIRALGLTPEQTDGFKKALNGILTDAYYSFLLGLDGAGSIGGRQRDYELRDEDGSVLTHGELEGPAWERFHGETSDENWENKPS
ncbi:MAG: hypothetical protein ACI8T1_002528 [Verrucomicrobiales bacterium]|jgi:hypothetical protein